MNLVCPHCMGVFPVESGLGDAELRSALVPALRLPAQLAPLLLRYLGLFRRGQRALAPARLGRLLTELVEVITSGRCTFDGEDVAAPIEVWQQALQYLEDSPPSEPLKSHGYLKRVVVGLARKHEAAQEKLLVEQRQAAGLRSRILSGGSPATVNPAAASVDQVLAKIRAGEIERESGLDQIAALGMSRERAAHLLGAA